MPTKPVDKATSNPSQAQISKRSSTPRIHTSAIGSRSTAMATTISSSDLDESFLDLTTAPFGQPGSTTTPTASDFAHPPADPTTDTLTDTSSIKDLSSCASFNTSSSGPSPLTPLSIASSKLSVPSTCSSGFKKRSNPKKPLEGAVLKVKPSQTSVHPSPLTASPAAMTPMTKPRVATSKKKITFGKIRDS